MKPLDDISLVTQVAVFRNKRAFDKLVLKYQEGVRRFFLNQTLGNELLADDLAQETFIKAYTHIAHFKGLSNFSTWLYKIAYNVYYDHVRSPKNTAHFDVTELKTHATTGADSTLKLDLYEAFQTLNDKERTCITLQLVEGYAIDKIATIMELPAGTVKSHLSRGKEKLSTYLKNNGYDK